MGESVAGHAALGPISTPWDTTEIVFVEGCDRPVEVNRDLGQLSAGLGDINDRVTSSHLERREGVRIPVFRDLYFRRQRTVELKEGLVCFLGEA